MEDFDYILEDGTELYRWEAERLYDEWLNEVYEWPRLGDFEFEPSRALKNLDPIAYRCGFNDWENFEMEDGRLDEWRADHPWLTSDEEEDEEETM